MPAFRLRSAVSHAFHRPVNYFRNTTVSWSMQWTNRHHCSSNAANEAQGGVKREETHHDAVRHVSGTITSPRGGSRRREKENGAGMLSRRELWLGFLVAGVALTVANSKSSVLAATVVSEAQSTSNTVKSISTSRLTEDQRFRLSEVDKKLRLNEKQHQVSIGRVGAYYTNWVGSNDPIEDKHSEHVWNSKTLIFGMFDGHGGYQCSTVLSHYLANYIARNLLLTEIGATLPNEASHAMKQAFVEIDQDLLSIPDIVFRNEDLMKQLPLHVRQNLLLPAIAGSCAIVTVIDGPHLYVANTGDSRALLGSYRNGQWVPIELSHDHTVQNPSEVKRVLSGHPGEERTVISRGRILGSLMPFRAFGDARYKWSPDVLERISTTIFKNSGYKRRWIPQNYWTPPYVTAEPEISYHKLEGSSFLVLATDGLWESLNNDEVVHLVGEFIRRHPEVMPKVPDSRSITKTITFSPDDLDSITDGKWVYVDDNVSTHLIRNALGGPLVPEHGINGRYVESLHTLLSVPSPYSRQYRDDITVTVVFFNRQSSEDVNKRNFNDGLAEIDLKKSRIELFDMGVTNLEEKD